MLCDSISMNYLEEANAQRQKAVKGYHKLGKGAVRSYYLMGVVVLFWGDKKDTLDGCTTKCR